MEATTTIRIQVETKARLDTFRVNGQSYDGLLCYLMDIIDMVDDSLEDNIAGALQEKHNREPALTERSK